MRPLTPADCLTLWEFGRALHPIDQGVLAVQTAFPEMGADTVADWPLGRLNRALAELHCTCFGENVRGWTTCRQCGEQLEFEVDGRTLSSVREPDIASSVALGDAAFRLPTSRDLAYLATQPITSRTASLLLERCSVSRESTPPRELSEADLDELGRRLALADPLAEILLQFDCPTCSDSFQEPLELASFVWSELEADARHLLLDVHTLALTYGWSEADILAMSPVRRHLYLEMVNA